MVAIAQDRIQKTPQVIGGRACIGRTRVAVWTLMEWMQLGISDDRLLADYPDITTDDLQAARAYYDEHTAEIEADIRDNNRD